MKLYKNYKKEDFYQILPLFFLKDRNQLIVLLGFGTKNIALIFGKNIKQPISSTSGVPLLPTLQDDKSTSAKRWVAKVDKINNRIRIEAEVEPVTNATKVNFKLDKKVLSTIVMVVCVLGVGMLAYSIYKRKK